MIHNNHGGYLQVDILPVKKTATYFIEQCVKLNTYYILREYNLKRLISLIQVDHTHL